MREQPGIAVVFPYRLERAHHGKEMLVVAEALQSRGHHVELHCVGAEPGEWPLPVHVADLERLQSADYWRPRPLSAALVYSFLHHDRLLSAVRAAGFVVVGKADTTGFISARLHARKTLEYVLFDAMPDARRSLALASWLARAGPLDRWDARRIRRVVSSCDTFVVETGPARQELLRVLERAGAPSGLADAIEVIPNPVSPVFTRGPLPDEKEDIVVAVGRWADPAKNAPLLARALRRFVASHPGYRVRVVGGDAERAFARLSPSVELTGRVGQEELRAILAPARIVVSSSRWESFSLSANEGLAMGCSVAGPNIPAFRQITELGPFGTLSADRSSGGLARALAGEAAAWAAGDRDPQGIAREWRSRVDVDPVVSRYAAALRIAPADGSLAERAQQ